MGLHDSLCEWNGGKKEMEFIILSKENISSTGSTEEIKLRKGKFLCRSSAAPQLKLKENSIPAPSNGGLGVENGWIGLFSNINLGRSPHTHLVISSAFFRTDTSFAA